MNDVTYTLTRFVFVGGMLSFLIWELHHIFNLLEERRGWKSLQHKRH